MKVRGIFKIKFVVISLLVALTISCAFGFLGAQKSYASTEFETKLVLPSSKLEYYSPNSPVGVYSDENVTAIMQNTDPNTLLVYKDGVFSTLTAPSLTDVNKLNDNTLIFSSQARIKQINLNSFDSESPSASVTPYKLDQTDSIATTYFELTENYIITAYERELKIFKLDTLTQLGSTTNIFHNSRIAASNNDTFYYVTESQEIYKCVITDAQSTNHSFVTDANPTEIIANENYVFYVENDKIFKIDVNTNQTQELSFIKDEYHQLGNTTINASTRLSFRNDNLLITDVSLNAIQEFAVGENSLTFTGFAIAKDKTAYNRISKTVSEVERYGDTLAVLDGDKLSIINATEDFDTFDKDNFKHYFVKDLTGSETGIMPDTFALGNGSALLLYGQGSNQSALSVINLKATENAVKTLDIQKSIRDICYQSGKYYLFCNEGNLKSIYQADETNLEFTPILEGIETDAEFIEVDVFGKIYIYRNDKIYLVSKTDNSQISINALASISGVKKLATDLGGTIFALTDTSVNYLDNNGSWVKFDVPVPVSDVPVSDAKIQSFTMDFDKKIVYFVYQSQEFIYSTTSLPNVAIDNIDIPPTFVLSAPNADLTTFKAYKAEENANVYSVYKNSIKNKFGFNELVSSGIHYAFITEVNVSDGLGKTLSLYALAGQDGLVLINKAQVVDVTPEIILEVPNSAYITTGVNGYYLPLITKNAEYSLEDTKQIRLQKEQSIKPLAKITFLDKEYYFAEFEVFGITHKGYVPVSFTIEVLSQDFKWNEYFIEYTKKIDVYSDKELTQKVTELKKDTQVRVLGKQDGVLNIAYQTENGWTFGYISEKGIKDNGKIAIRNILLILAVTASVCGTSTYFVLRKKS